MAADIKRIASLARIQRFLRYRWSGSSIWHSSDQQQALRLHLNKRSVFKP